MPYEQHPFLSIKKQCLSGLLVGQCIQMMAVVFVFWSVRCYYISAEFNQIQTIKLNLMAQKLAIALVALFGFVNAGVLAGEAPSLAVQNIAEHRPELSRARTVVVQEHIVVPQHRPVVVQEHVVVQQHRPRHVHVPAHHHGADSQTSDSHSTSSSHEEGARVHVKHVKRIHHTPQKIEVPDVSFNRLKYADDTLGESYKAPHTIITVPLAHNIAEQAHHVAINENLGRSNCPECVKNEKRGNRIQKKAEKQLVQYDEKLQVQIEAPIEKTLVKPDRVDKDEHRETNYDKYDHLNRHEYVLLRPNVRVHHDDHDSYTDSFSSEGGHHYHKGAKRVIVHPRSTILTVGAPARRVVAETIVVSHGVDPRGENTLHETEAESGVHRHHYNDNIDRASLPGQLARGEYRQNTPLAVGILNLKGKRVEYNHHD